jgi:hypothetical protein
MTRHLSAWPSMKHSIKDRWKVIDWDRRLTCWFPPTDVSADQLSIRSSVAGGILRHLMVEHGPLNAKLTHPAPDNFPTSATTPHFG